MVLSGLVSLLLAPLRARLVRAGVPAVLAVLLTVAVYVAALVVSGVLVVFGVADFLRAVPAYQSELSSAIDDALGSEQLGDALSALVAGSAEAVASGATSVLSLVGYSVVVVAYLGAEAAHAERRILWAAGGRVEALDRVRRTGERLRTYVIARSILGFVVAVADTAVLLLLGVPSAFLWGVVAFLFGFVPNVGFIVALIPPAVLGLLVGGPITATLVIVAYSAINVTVDYLIQPQYIGSSVDLSPLVVTLSLIFWVIVLGPVGALLAVPLTIGVAALADSFSDSRPLARLLTRNVD